MRRSRLYMPLLELMKSSFTATVPTIVEDLGYTSANAQLMTIPVYIFAVICVLVVACKSQSCCYQTSL